MESETTQRMETPQQVSRVTVRAPPFWKKNPQIWFKQLESQFLASGITTDETKYHTAVAALETDILTFVSDLIMEPPTTNKYETLKTRLEKHFAESEELKFKRLLQDMELGDKKPSFLLQEMRQLSGTQVGDDFLKSIWISRLPRDIQAILSASSDELNKLAEMADKIMNITVRDEVATFQPVPVPVHDTPESNETIATELVQLRKQVATLLRGRSIQRNRNFPRWRSYSRSRHEHSKDGTDGTKPYCWYHTTFGTKAKKCKPPCSFRSNQGNANTVP